MTTLTMKIGQLRCTVGLYSGAFSDSMVNEPIFWRHPVQTVSYDDAAVKSRHRSNNQSVSMTSCE